MDGTSTSTSRTLWVMIRSSSTQKLLLPQSSLLGRNDGGGAYHNIWQRSTTETFDQRSHVRERTHQANGVWTPRGWIATHAVGVVGAVE